MSLHELYADQRDKFAIVTIHDKTVTSFAELDKKLPKIREQYWQGKDLPFPVLLDPSQKTAELYKIRAFPTGLLIDPEGKLVGTGPPSILEAKLPPLPAGKQWARYLDLPKRIVWSFEPSNHTLTNLVYMLRLGMGWGTGCPVELDGEALKAIRLTPDGILPGVVIGSGVTLRSIDALLLEPLGLGVAPSHDGKKLLITRRPPAPAEESYPQKLHYKELTEQLDHGNGQGKPLEIKNQTLLDAFKRIGNEYDFPFALDAKAIRAGTLDPQARVSGRMEPKDLRQSITRMIEPLGLRLEVRHEVVFLTPKGN
jgi:hypothetical protein